MLCFWQEIVPTAKCCKSIKLCNQSCNSEQEETRQRLRPNRWRCWDGAGREELTHRETAASIAGKAQGAALRASPWEMESASVQLLL